MIELIIAIVVAFIWLFIAAAIFKVDKRVKIHMAQLALLGKIAKQQGVDVIEVEKLLRHGGVYTVVGKNKEGVETVETQYS